MMSQEDIDKIYAALKEKYWKPEWDSMSENERLKDSQYCGYLHEILEYGLKFARSQRELCRGLVEVECIDVIIEFYEKSLKGFKRVP